MYKIGLEEFNEAYSIFENAFCKEELRSYHKMKDLFINHEIVIFGIKNNNELVSVVLSWEFDSFTFLENFAVKEEYRNQGLGSKCLDDIKKYYKVPIILEAEKPYDELSKRRLEFYKRNGFYLTSFEYLQPALHKITRDIPLVIFSYPKAIDETDFYYIKSNIFSRVYKKKTE